MAYLQVLEGPFNKKGYIYSPGLPIYCSSQATGLLSSNAVSGHYRLAMDERAWGRMRRIQLLSFLAGSYIDTDLVGRRGTT